MPHSPATVPSLNDRTPLLDVRDLTTVFHTTRGTVTAVDALSFTLRTGRTLGIVGESGCGKSVTALSIMRLLSLPAGETVAGSVLFEGKDLLKLTEKEMRSVRGNDISMIFQEPMTSLNPVFKVGEQVAEVIRLHRTADRKSAWNEAVELLRKVGIPAPERRAEEYPHQMSGGMRQRVMIAIALACSPKLIIADEPTTALDVTIQGQILDLMKDLSQSTGSALMLITHDLGVVAETAEDVIVMYAGRIVEHSPVHDLFNTPLHPYTQGLLQSLPEHPLRLASHGALRKPLRAIPGTVPSLHNLPPGCKFNDRCPHAFDRCHNEEPGLIAASETHQVRCWLHA
ncbi:ABC transporter ATP-binding protein [Desulfovibrio subterraneus]|uniref:Peptide ABC transporter ATP-binding protein n=1 Tax=Desulfovibrio subterraneus TaxID=2718620 RepID=A0A7J0BDX9_9BACT|nr:ABC transporter ATP-binding protein [Desulfovibrio subterraneus]GFM31913.1 peptide ABC transporter ATP-binding protein [Desulfovibrio subterraneus]